MMEAGASARPPARVSRRFAPRNSVTVAIHDSDNPFAYGVVTNISPSGACLVTANPLPTGTTVFLRVSFYRQPDMFETKARVVWSRQGGQDEKLDTMEGLLFHGVQFAETSTNQRSHLLQLLDSTEFQLVYSPQSCDFDTFMSELSEDLNKLGSKFGQETGSNE
jgi:hypothetical protein